MRVCLIYDCLYPFTIGGAERWYRDVAERLAADGHDVTYVTLRQWERGAEPEIPGVRVHSAGPRMELYVEGRRRILPPLVFGAGVLWHLLRHGRGYDVVQTASFPYFSLLAAAFVRRLARYRLRVDWIEVWSLDYWRGYLGRVGGRIGWLVQRLCTKPRQEAFCISRLHAERLRGEGLHGEITVLEGLYRGSRDPATPAPAEPLVVFAGRHIPEKQPAALPAAVARARESIPGLRGVIFGDGPERPRVLEEIERAGVDGAVEAPGFVDYELVDDALRSALCMVLPSLREGYGLVVVESAHRGTPAVLVRGADNAATELIVEGENGFVADSSSPADLAAAIRRVHDAGPALRESTAAWFNANVERLSLEGSLRTIAERYAAY